jgi:sporulation protein YlmC with PRC-barrel domain
MSIKTRLLTSVAAFGLIAGAAIAQSQYAPGWNEDLDTTYGAIADTRVVELIGMNVVTQGGDDVGEVDNFVIMQDRVQAVVGVGGFLGLGEHEVALPLDELAYDGEKLIIAYTEEELRAMPEYTEELEQTAFAEDDTFRTRAMSGGETTAEGDATMPADQDSTAMNMADGTIEDASEADAPTGEDVAAAEDAAGGEKTMTEEVAEAKKGAVEQEVEEIVAETDQAVTEGAEAVADAAAATGEAVKAGAEGAAQMAENAAEATGDAIEEGAEEVAKAADAAGDAVAEGAEEVADAADAATKPMGAWDEQLAGEFAGIADAPVSDITAFPVVTADGETIGEIEALARHNDKVVALVGVGGFLGIGEHDVALDLGELSFDGEKFIAVGYTEEDLKAMPEYDEDAIERIEGDVTLRSAL